MNFIKIIKQNKLYYLIVTIFLITNIFTQYSIPVITQFLVDSVVLKSGQSIFLLILFLCLLRIINIITNFSKGYITLNTSKKITLSIGENFFKNIFSPYNDKVKLNNGQITESLKDISRVEEFLTDNIVKFVFAIATITIQFFLLFSYNKTIFIIFLLSTIVYFSWTTLLNKQRRKLDINLFNQRSEINDFVLDSNDGFYEIRQASFQEKIIQKWAFFQKEFYENVIKMFFVNNIQGSGNQIVNIISSYLALFISCNEVVNDKMSIGTLFAVQYIIAQLSLPTMDVVNFIKGRQFAKLSFERLNLFNNDFSKIKKIEFNYDDFENIEMQDISYFSNNKLILDGINLNIKKNSKTAILGISGAGKSTLLKILVGNSKQTKGDLLLSNNKLIDYDSSTLYKNIGYISSESHIFNESILKNIILNEIHIESKLIEVLEKSLLLDFVNSLKDGVETKIGKNGKQISSGQRQRIFIARLLYKNPNIIILDECFNYLDNKSEQLIKQNLLEIFIDKTVIIVDHKSENIDFVDNRYIMNNGKLENYKF